MYNSCQWCSYYCSLAHVALILTFVIHITSIRPMMLIAPQYFHSFSVVQRVPVRCDSYPSFAFFSYTFLSIRQKNSIHANNIQKMCKRFSVANKQLPALNGSDKSYSIIIYWQNNYVYFVCAEKKETREII